MATFDPDDGATSNELFRDALVRRQIYLSKYANGLQSDIIELLDSTEGAIRREIEKRLGALVGADGTLRDFSATAHAKLKVLQNAIAKIRADAFDEAQAMWDEHMAELAQNESDYLDRNMKDVSPVKLDTVLPDPDMLAAIVSVQPMQGNLLSEWASSLQDQDVTRIMNTIRAGMAQGKSTDGIVRDVLGTGTLNGSDGIVETTRRAAASITQTAVATVAGEARQAYYEANDDIVDQEQFVATLDSHTTEECMALDGELFDVDDGPQPPLHWNCRSTRVAVIDGTALGDRPAVSATEDILDGLDPDERAEAIANMVGQVPATTTYQQFLERQSKAFQDEALGPARAEMFRNGTPLKAFVNKNLEPYTLDELKARQ